MSTWLHTAGNCIVDQFKLNTKAFVGQTLLIAGCVLTSAKSPDLTALLVGGSLAYNIICDFLGSPKKEQHRNQLRKQHLILQGLINVDSGDEDQSKLNKTDHKSFKIRVNKYLKPLFSRKRENVYRIGGLILGIATTCGAIYLTIHEPQDGTAWAYIQGGLTGLGASLTRIGRGIYDAPLAKEIRNLEQQLGDFIKDVGKKNRAWRFDTGLALLATKNPETHSAVNDIKQLISSVSNEH